MTEPSPGPCSPPVTSPTPARDFAGMTCDPELSDGAFRTYCALVTLSGGQRSTDAYNADIEAASGGVSQPTVSKHLRQLERLGYIRREKDVTEYIDGMPCGPLRRFIRLTGPTGGLRLVF